MKPNYVFEADAVRQRTVSCSVRAPRGSTRRWATNMLRSIALLVGSLGVVFGANAADLPTIVVDESHIGFSRPDGSEPSIYTIKPSPGLVVDPSKYTITVPKEYGVSGPNYIHIIMGQNNKYKTPWKGEKHKHILSAATLKPLPGSAPFVGFSSGDTVMIAIGFDHTGITTGKDNTLSAMWLGMVKVQ